MNKQQSHSEDWIRHALSRNVESIITERELREKIAHKKKLRIKFGVDVTHPLLHVGHAVNLWKMKEFQDHGHTVVFLIGDFTSRIGDPTGRSAARVARSRDDIERDAKTYLSQVKKILSDDPAVFEVRKNSEWYDPMPLSEFFSLLGNVTHARLIERDMFQRRMHEGSEIYMHEVLYPILQGYDSYKVMSDLTIVGNDQLFNELLGRHYQEALGQEPQVIMTTVITPGLDGKEKQSKSLGNFIAISDTPKDMYGKVMTLPDNLICVYMSVYTDEPPDAVEECKNRLSRGENPRDVKMDVARSITARYHGAEAALAAEREFVDIFQKKEYPGTLDIADISDGEAVYGVLKRLRGSSHSDAQRLLNGGAVAIDDARIDDGRFVFSKKDDGRVLRIGKKTFYRIHVV